MGIIYKHQHSYWHNFKNIRARLVAYYATFRVQSIKSLLRASYCPVRRCDQLISSRKSITLMFIISSRDEFTLSWQNLGDRCFCWFSCRCPSGWALTWQLHTKLSKFGSIISLEQQQQVYFKINIAYKACARNQQGLFEAGTRGKREVYNK